MRIKELHIMRYGPLSFKRPISPGTFSVIFGKNEEGKSLTIDALVKFLFGRKVSEFTNIERVETLPEGYLLVEGPDGENAKLPERGLLTDITGLTQRECANIFIIRNSNLSISRQDDFFTDITDRLTGLKTAEIAHIKTALMEMGRLTESRDKIRDIKGEKLKSRLEGGAILIERIDNLISEMKESGFDDLYEREVLLDEEIGEITTRREDLEDARKRELYETCSAALGTIEANEKKYTELALFTEEDEQNWRSCEKSLIRLEREKADSHQRIREKEAVLKETREKFEDKKRSLSILNEKRESIAGEMPRLRNIEKWTAEIAAQVPLQRFITVIFSILAVLAIVSLAGAVSGKKEYFLILGGFFLLGLTVAAVFKLMFLRRRGRLKKNHQEMHMQLSSCGLNGETLALMLENIQKFEDDWKFLSDEVNAVRAELIGMEQTIQELKDRRLQSLETEISAERDRIRTIQEKSVMTIDQYTENLQEKRKLQSGIQEQQTLLRQLLREEDGAGGEESINYWKKRIEELRKYRGKAAGVVFDGEVFTRIKDELEQKNAERDRLGEEIERYSRKLEDVERDLHATLRPEDEHFPCATTVDLEAAKEALVEFIDLWETTREDVGDVLKLFDEIEQEEKQKVQSLFGGSSNVTKNFMEITGGRYTEVLYNRDAASIDVREESGEILSVEKLSSGAYDQLYLSIRLALGKSLLKDRCGFFIFDDPFIKADPERLERQFTVLMDIADRGWQVLFFSAKGEIAHLVERINRKKRKIDFIELHKNLIQV